MGDQCKWPNGECACYTANAQKADSFGRVWMHCDKGLSMSRASMSRLMMFCLPNNVEIGSIHPFNYRFRNSQVSVSVRLRPDQFLQFEEETRGKLREPPRISLNWSTPEFMGGE